MIEIGIDEAGYGPLLGPLVVTAWGMSYPGDPDLWTILKTAVSRRSRPGKLIVADSKDVYSPGTGLSRLEGTVLSFLNTAGVPASTYAGLLADTTRGSCPENTPDWCDRDGLKIPAAADPDVLQNTSALLDQTLKDRNVRVEHVSSRVVMPRAFNESVRVTGNKLVTLFSHITSLIKEAAAGLGERLCRVKVDKLSSTRRYGKLLGEFFSDHTVEVKKEDRDISSYNLTCPDGNTFDLDFIKKGDRKEFLVALASMQSKYLRELEMRVFNDFWHTHLPGIPPTAGYFTDGKRFIAQIRQQAVSLGIPEEDFIRAR